MLNLTKQDVKNDIRAFQARIQAAQTKLDRLPKGYLSFKEYTKREAKRKELFDEIIHVRKLINIAEERLNDWKKT